MERYRPDQYGRMLPDPQGDWLSFPAVQIAVMDALMENTKAYDSKLADAQQAVERLEREMMEWKRALHSLTPGGSEYANDSKACVEWVREARSRQHETIVDGVKQRKDLQSQLAAAQKQVAGYDRWLSGGVYYTNAEFEEQINDRVNLRNARAALEQQVAQLREERDALRDSVCDMNNDLVASNAQVEGLGSELTTLRGLVEKLPVVGLPVEHSRPDDFIVMNDGEGWLACTCNYWARFATEDEAKAYAALLQYRATLPCEGGAQNDELGTWKDVEAEHRNDQYR